MMVKPVKPRTLITERAPICKAWRPARAEGVVSHGGPGTGAGTATAADRGWA